MFFSQDLSFYIISLGCSKNLVDSEYLNGALVSAGFHPAESGEDADIIIVNTCGFIEDAKKESIDVIFDVLSRTADVSGGTKVPAARGASGFTKKSVALGCLVSRYAGEIKKEIPEIDFLYGLVDEGFVPALCRALDISPGRRIGFERRPLDAGAPFSYIKIADGCSNRCSYCAIPLIRGPQRSFAPEAIIADAERAVRAGARELIIVAQDIASYCHRTVDLPELVNGISRIEGVEWIRLMYCHPDHISDSLIELLRRNDRVVKYLDIPFQHASGRILRSMNRKGDRASYTALVEKLRDRVPGIHIRSTFLVGFPGETEEDFHELAGFLKDVRLERVGCFAYSPEENTPAASLGDALPARTKRKRYNAVMTLQKKISTGRLREMVGSTVRVLVEEKVDADTWAGRTEFDAPEVDGIFYLTAHNVSVNTIVNALITDAVEYDLVGVLAGR